MAGLTSVLPLTMQSVGRLSMPPQRSSFGEPRRSCLTTGEPRRSLKAFGAGGGGPRTRRQSVLASIGCEERAAEEQRKQQGSPRDERAEGEHHVEVCGSGPFGQEIQAARRLLLEELGRSFDGVTQNLYRALQEELADSRNKMCLRSLGSLPLAEGGSSSPSIELSPVSSPRNPPVQKTSSRPSRNAFSMKEAAATAAAQAQAPPSIEAHAVKPPQTAPTPRQSANHLSVRDEVVMITSVTTAEGEKITLPSSVPTAVASEEDPVATHPNRHGRRTLSSASAHSAEPSASSAEETQGVNYESSFASSKSSHSADSGEEADTGGVSAKSSKSSKNRDSAAGEGAKNGVQLPATTIKFSSDTEFEHEQKDPPQPRRRLLRSFTGESSADGAFGREDGGPSFSFEVLECWSKNKQLAAKLGKLRKPIDQDVVPRTSAYEDSESDESDESSDDEDTRIRRTKGFLKQIIVHPSSVKRGVWEMTSLLLVFYDIIWIPFQLFEPPELDIIDNMNWATRLFWTLDIVASLISGYVTHNGSVELRPNKIFRRYARSWMSLDLFVVGIDWLEIFFTAAQGGGYFRFGRAARAFRIVRMVRLLRLLRVKEFLSIVFESVQSEKLKEMSQMIKIVLLILISGHLFACFWYGLGDSNWSNRSWVDTTFGPEDYLTYRYTTALHWSLSQYTGGMDEIRPVNAFERFYAIIVLTFCLMVGTVLVSSLTSSMTHLNFLANEKKTKMTLLMRYLRENRISNRLMPRVQRNAQSALANQEKNIPEAHVELLSLVSEPLRIELHFELYAPILRHHPFFAAFIDESPMVMHKVCHQAPSMVGVSTGDIIFNIGEIPPKPKMIIVVEGTLAYLAYNGKSGGARQSIRKSTTGGSATSGTELGDGVDSPRWIAEPSLWTLWMHRGTLTARKDSKLCLLDAEKFQDTVTAFDHDDFNPKVYAANYVERLNLSDDLSDLAVDVQKDALDSLHSHVDRVRLSRRRRHVRRTSITVPF